MLQSNQAPLFSVLQFFFYKNNFVICQFFHIVYCNFGLKTFMYNLRFVIRKFSSCRVCNYFLTPTSHKLINTLDQTKEPYKFVALDLYARFNIYVRPSSPCNRYRKTVIIYHTSSVKTYRLPDIQFLFQLSILFFHIDSSSVLALHNKKYYFQ